MLGLVAKERTSEAEGRGLESRSGRNLLTAFNFVQGPVLFTLKLLKW